MQPVSSHPARVPASPRIRGILPVAAFCPALLAFLVRLLTGPHPVDDAYITFRYARNLADGLGLVYNPGESVLGTTTPLWAILLGAFHRLAATDVPTVALLLSAHFDSVSAGLLALLVRELRVELSLAAILAFTVVLTLLGVRLAGVRVYDPEEVQPARGGRLVPPGHGPDGRRDVAL